MRLVVTAKPEPTESMMGFVLRLTELNGYPTTAFVLNAMGTEWYRQTVGRLDAAGLGAIAGISQDDIDRLTHKPALQPRTYVRVYGADLPSYEVTLGRPKFCPACFSEGRTCEAFWDLAQAVVCPMHQVQLVSDCPGCGNRVKWSRTKVRQCKCGFDLGSASAVPATPALVELMAVLRNRVYLDESVAPLPPAMSHLAHLSLRRLCKLIWVMSGVVHQAQGGARAPKARHHYRAQLDVVAAALTNWPLGFRDFLSVTYVHVLQSSEELPHFQTIFSWLLQRLVKNDKGDRSTFDFLEREIYRFGAQYWTPGSMARDEASRRLLPEDIRWRTMCELSEATGLHIATIKKRITSGEIKIRRIKKNSRRGFLIDMHSIRLRPLTQYPAMPVRDAAPRIGVSIETLKELRASGVVKEVYRSRFPDSLTREDVDAFAARIRDLGRNRRAISSPDVTTLHSAFGASILSPKEKAMLIARLLAEPAVVVGKKKGRGIGSLQVSKHAVSAFLQDVRSDVPECLSVKKAADRLGCAPCVVAALKRGRHLSTIRQRGRNILCLASVVEFERKYEALTRIATPLGTTARWAYARVDFNGIEHIVAKSTQHSTVFVHRRHVKTIQGAIIERSGRL